MCPSGFTGINCESETTFPIDPFTIEPHPIEITTPAETTVVSLERLTEATSTPSIVPSDEPSSDGPLV
jgi:hypothetical protein